MRSRWCKTCGGWHDLEQAWPHDRQASSGIQIIKDIDPYQAIATDVATGKRPNITSRSQHREFLRRNGYVEMGNDMPAPKADLDLASGQDIKQAIHQLRNR